MTEAQHMHIAFIVRDDKAKFRDYEDLVKIGRDLGQQAFKTDKNVRVVKILGPLHEAISPFREIGYVVVVAEPEKDGCSTASDVEAKRQKLNEKQV